MGKVKQAEIKRNEKSTAMTRSEENERARRQAAIQAMARRGFDAIADASEDVQEIAEAGLVDKASLVGVPFYILDVQTRDGDYGSYVSVTAILKTNEVVVFNDGSTGIAAQLEGIEVSPEKPVFVRGGLRASEYTNKHTNTPSTTYYLSGRPPPSEIAGITKGGAGARNGRQARAPF